MCGGSTQVNSAIKESYDTDVAHHDMVSKSVEKCANEHDGDTFLQDHFSSEEIEQGI